MSLGVFLAHVMILGIAAGASINNTAHLNETGRSGRTYDSQQFLKIPVGYYKPSQEESSTSTESEEDSTPKRDVPTSFDDFIPSDRRTQNKYPSYYKSKSSYKSSPPSPPPVNNWKGDWGNADSSPSWMTPSPADMAMMVNLMKEMNGAPPAADAPTGFLSKLASDPAAVISGLLVPAAIILGAVIPFIIPLFTGGNTKAPVATTTASGSDQGRKLGDSPSFVRPILEAIESFSSRSASSGHTCLQKSFCEATRSSNQTDFRPVQRSIYKAFTFVDDYWLETLGVKQLMEAMGTGNCEKIHCGTLSIKEKASKNKQA